MSTVTLVIQMMAIARPLGLPLRDGPKELQGGSRRPIFFTILTSFSPFVYYTVGGTLKV